MAPLTNHHHIKRGRISNIEDALFKQAWNLYQASFSIDERRMIDDQNRIMNHPFYHFELLFLEETFLGILLWWQFEHLRYVEHFAISDAHKNQGYGSLVLKGFQSEQIVPILLEVEKPESHTQKKRVLFYQNLGFQRSSYTYFQPPYAKNRKSIPLDLMSWPQSMDKNIFNYFIHDCHSIIFANK